MVLCRKSNLSFPKNQIKKAAILWNVTRKNIFSLREIPLRERRHDDISVNFSQTCQFKEKAMEIERLDVTHLVISIENSIPSPFFWHKQNGSHQASYVLWSRCLRCSTHALSCWKVNMRRWLHFGKNDHGRVYMNEQQCVHSISMFSWFGLRVWEPSHWLLKATLI